MLCCSNNGHDDDNQDNHNGYPNDNAHLSNVLISKGKN